MNPPEQSPQTSGKKISFPLLVLGVVCIVIAVVIGINDNPPGVILLLGGSFTLLLSFLLRMGKSRNLRPAQRVLYWTPRALCIVFAVLISAFALDVFEETNGFWETSLALLMHLIPTFVIVGVLLVSWRREWVGGIIFNALALLYVVTMWGKFPLSTYLLIAGPLVITGTFFLLSWRYKEKIQPTA